jgi:hypothetical protein
MEACTVRGVVRSWFAISRGNSVYKNVAQLPNRSCERNVNVVMHGPCVFSFFLESHDEHAKD